MTFKAPRYVPEYKPIGRVSIDTCRLDVLMA